MSFDELDGKNSDSLASGKILIITLISSLTICLIAVIIWLSSIKKGKVTAVKALTSTPARQQTQVDPIVSIDEQSLLISNAQVTSVPSFYNDESEFDSAIKTGQTYRSIDSVDFSEYTVLKDDSVALIAKKFGLRNQTLIQINGLKTVYPAEGTVLIIPSIDGQMYTVQQGDTFFSISQRYNLSMSWSTFKSLNSIDGDELTVGMRLFIPHSSVKYSQSVSSQSIADTDKFILPVRDGNISSHFSDTTKHPFTLKDVELDGIIIQTLSAADVYCCESGTVVDRGFNQNGTSFVKISHDDGYTSYYDFLTWVNLEVGQHISKGEVIGSISDGNTKLITPTLFFRIEQDGIALDPSFFF